MRKRSLLQSFKNAFAGFFYTLRTQRNFRIHLLAAFLVLGGAYFLRIEKTEVLILLFTILLVLVVEMVNTAFESIVDLVTIEHKREAKIAKDVAAGAVLLVAALVIIIGIIIFGPYLWLSF